MATAREKVELPEESKNVIHKNEANVSDPSRVCTPKTIHYLSQMHDVYIKQKQFDQDKKFSVSSPCPAHLLSCRVGLS